MTTTSHTNCTHAATKADRAICRTAAASGRTYDEQRSLMIQSNATVSRRAMIAARAKPAAEPVDYSNVDYAFETTTCGRCDASNPGFIQHYAGVYGGVCFSCNKSGQSKSKGLVLTRAGAAAKKAHDAWIADHLMIPARELEVGMKFRPNAVDGWKTIVSIDTEPHFAGTYTIGSGDNAVTTEMWHINIVTQKSHYSIDADTLVARSATPAERAALIAHIANRKGTIITPR